jgi:hypothetical protein
MRLVLISVLAMVLTDISLYRFTKLKKWPCIIISAIVYFVCYTLLKL